MKHAFKSQATDIKKNIFVEQAVLKEIRKERNADIREMMQSKLVDLERAKLERYKDKDEGFYYEQMEKLEK